jgi:four helix bundle protein
VVYQSVADADRNSCDKLPPRAIAESETEMGAEIRSFRDLEAWQVPMGLVLLAYAIAAKLPSSERFELSSQIRRAAVSVPANVAEGQGSGRAGRFIYHLGVALGSLAELETLFEVAVRQGFLTRDDVSNAMEQLNRSGRLLHGLLRSLKLRRLRNGVSACVLLAGLAAALLR